MSGNRVSRENVPQFIPVGTTIWRECRFRRVGLRLFAEMMPINFREAPNRNGYTCRVGINDTCNGIYEPCAIVSRYGVVCLVPKVPPPDWTHLVVTGSGHSNNIIFAEYQGSLPEKNYLEFRLEMYRQFAGMEEASNRELFETFSSIEPYVSKPMNRLFVNYLDGEIVYLRSFNGELVRS